MKSIFWVAFVFGAAVIIFLSFYLEILPPDWRDLASRSFCAGKGVETVYRQENPKDKNTKMYWVCKQ